MRIGYARVSTDDQNLDLQQDALCQARVDKSYEDNASGKSLDRPQLAECLRSLRKGDTLIVWRLDRLGRSVKDLVALINELRERGVEFVSLTEAIDTTTPMGSFIFHITAALAELERSIIRERTRAGLVSARARGRKGGRPKKAQRSRVACCPHACGRSRTDDRGDRLAVWREPGDDLSAPTLLRPAPVSHRLNFVPHAT
jgi:DNA invertase Pin-like site-specific DNA recombinase